MVETVIRWNLNEVMARHHVRGIDLAEEMGVRAATVSSLRKSTALPRIDAERLDSILKALNKLAKPETVDGKIDVSDLIVWVEENDSLH